MDDSRLIRISRFLSKHLRHQPQRLGLRLMPGAWVPVDDLLSACARHNLALTRAELEEVVARNDKQRFGFDPTGTLIRARQGHSVAIDLQLAPAVPPPVLFHGTAERNLAAILGDGLLPMSRHHVHLSPDRETALRVGARHGRPVVLQVDAAAMRESGAIFLRSDNGVWLVDRVAPEHLAVL
jgi:putative RNA 2'-phosphotransferase